MQQLIALFNFIAALSPGLEDHLQDILKPRVVPRKEIILSEGEIAKNIYFIEKGLLRSYYFLNQEEVSNWFMKEGDIFVSVHSFFSQQPSHEMIESLEEAIIWGISYDQLQYIYKNFPEFNYHRGYILEKYYALSEHRHYLTRRHSAYNRYMNFIENYPELIRRVPAKYIASYLGLTETSFSRIKAQYAYRQRGKRL